jgi:hypothetical protein
MSKITTTNKINIDQLSHESKIDMNIVSDPDGTTTIESSVKQDVLESFVAAHQADDKWINPTPPKAEPTISDKLAGIGLSIDDLKAALGV